MMRISKCPKPTIIALALLLCALVAFPAVVLAIVDPATPPQVNGVFVYEDLLEDGDIGVLVDYYLDYAVLPPTGETVTESYLVVFIDNDGITQLASVAPYSYSATNKGFRHGLAWIYFPESEVIAHTIHVADVALYRVWLTGNPTVPSGWTGDPPKTVATIDYWQTTGDSATLLALRVLYFAQELETDWALDMIQTTSLGSKLTSGGETYFTNVIPNLRLMAPSAFSELEVSPDNNPLNYDTTFGATMANGAAPTGGALTGSPITFTNLTTSGEADAGTNVTLDDAILTQGNDYWIGARLTITNTADGLAPMGETATITGFTAATDRLAFAALTAAVGAGDRYTLRIGEHGAAESGTATTLVDRRLTQPDDYWIGARIAVITTTDGAAPQGEDALITDFDAADNRLTFGALTAAVGEGDTYVLGLTHVDTTAFGTFTLTLTSGTIGYIIDGTAGVVPGSPVALVPGINTVTTTVNGDFNLVLYTWDTITKLEDITKGTGFDLTDVGAKFGMSRWMFSSLIWLLMTVIICAAVFRIEMSGDGINIGSSGGKVIMLVFTVCVIGGTLLGLLHPMVSSLLFICCGALIGYVFFFRSDALHKGFMFMIWMFVIVSLAGNIMAGSTSMVATRLTADVPVGTITSISVASTNGFPDSGIVVIGDERIGYPHKTATTFERTAVAGVTINPINRGVSGTTDAAHAANALVRTVEAGILNASIDYKIAQLADTAGIMGYLTFPAKLLGLLLTFFTLPFSFLGTDFAILTYIWMVVAIGMVVGFVMALAGGRRV